MHAPVTIITGAGSGVGRATAQLLARAGHRLALAGRRHEALLETAESCVGAPEILCHRADLSLDLSASQLIEAVVANFGRIDNLVNCAGIAPMVPIAQTTEQHLSDCFGINTLGPALLIIRCWPHFAAQKSARIVNVSSLATSDPYAGFFAYAASKSALDSLTRSADKEGAAIGVKAFSINLGCVETALLRSFADEQLVPKSRALAPEYVAQVIAQYLSGSRDSEHGTCIALPSP
ncbi:MAG: SDR family oxidoreductase [Phycisphaerales bacterium]|nr:SDR family oxidoreductase [Phycisphaerales bacterium]